MNLWLIAALWVGLALFAAMLSIRVGIAVALVENSKAILESTSLIARPQTAKVVPLRPLSPEAASEPSLEE